VRAVFWIALAAAATLHFVADDRKREPIDAFVSRFKVAERRPAHEETIRYAPAADLAAEVAADVALQDNIGTVNLTSMDLEARELWIEAVAHYDEELVVARELLLDAIRDRPGWPFHRALLGEIEFARAGAASRWLPPLESAMRGSPGEDSFATFTATAVIEAWPVLNEGTRARGRSVFGRAMRDPQFVRASYLDLVEILGHDAVFSLVPDSAAALRAAMNAEAEVADVEATAQLFPRWERAEWRERDEDLRQVETRARLGDTLGLRRECSEWMARHSITDFDARAGRQQVARLLELWPDEPGSWANDGRSTLIAYFLDGRRKSIDGRTIARAAAWLSDVPRPLAARAALAGGDVYAAEALARSSDTAGSFEWTRFYVELAEHHLRARNVDGAAAALSRVAPAAQNECDVLVARRAVSRAAGKPLPRAGDPDTYTREDWARNRLPVCIDGNVRSFAARFEVSEIPALVSYGLNDGRLATILFRPGIATVTVPLDGIAGRRIFFYHLVAGGEVEPLVATFRD
jgi:hypothetical protein